MPATPMRLDQDISHKDDLRGSIPRIGTICPKSELANTAPLQGDVARFDPEFGYYRTSSKSDGLRRLYYKQLDLKVRLLGVRPSHYAGLALWESRTMTS